MADASWERSQQEEEEEETVGSKRENAITAVLKNVCVRVYEKETQIMRQEIQ